MLMYSYCANLCAGGVPYPSASMDETFIDRLRSGYRLPKPPKAPNGLLVIDYCVIDNQHYLDPLVVLLAEVRLVITFSILNYRRYNLMYKCWDAEPDRRPSFTEIAAVVGEMLESDLRQVRYWRRCHLSSVIVFYRHDVYLNCLLC